MRMRLIRFGGIMTEGNHESSTFSWDFVRVFRAGDEVREVNSMNEARRVVACRVCVIEIRAWHLPILYIHFDVRFCMFEISSSGLVRCVPSGSWRRSRSRVSLDEQKFRCSHSRADSLWSEWQCLERFGSSPRSQTSTTGDSSSRSVKINLLILSEWFEGLKGISSIVQDICFRNFQLQFASLCFSKIEKLIHQIQQTTWIL